MKKLLALLMAVPVLMIQPRVVRAGVPAGIACGGVDTNVNSTTLLATLSSCTFTTGPYGIVFVVASAEVTCSGTETVQAYIGSGASPVRGSNFTGSVDGAGTLTVDQTIPGLGTTPWLIEDGQTLTSIDTIGLYTPTTITGQLTGPGVTYDTFTGHMSDAVTLVVDSGGSAIRLGQTLHGSGISAGTVIVGGSSPNFFLSAAQTPFATPEAMTTTGTTGAVGTYSVADGSLSLPSNTNMFTLNPTAGGVTNITPVMSQTACAGGFVLTTISGAFTGTPNTQYWLGISIATDSNAHAAEWNNAQTAIFVY